MYLSVSDAAEKFKVSKRRVQTLCEQGRIPGAKRMSGVWLIPSDATKPEDGRKRRSIPKNQLSLFDDFCNMKNEKITLEKVCELLSISEATVKNWVRLGKLKMEPDGKTFNKYYIETILEEIRTGQDDRLKSRRNKKNISGKSVYKDYIKSESNRRAVEEIMNRYTHISEDEIRGILAIFALRLYEQGGGEILEKENILAGNKNYSDAEVLNELIKDLLGNVDITMFDSNKMRDLFEYDLQFVPMEDTLGFVYISLSDLSQRKLNGTYYTPAITVNQLIKQLKNCSDLEEKSICDPCCGTGNFLIGLAENGVKIENLYGFDLDEISILIARINMFLIDSRVTKQQLYSHFVCKDTLFNSFSKKFSVVLGNPPWGYDFDKDDIVTLKEKFKTAKNKGIESFDLFVEQGLSMLEENGYLAYVLPEAILSVASHQEIRELMLNSTEFRFVCYLGNAFSGVQCPSILLGLQKGNPGKTKNCKVTLGEKEFIMSKDRELDASLFSLQMDDDQYDCLQAIHSIENARFLANHAKFALGIVTGNNKEYIKKTKEEGTEPILKGSDVYRYAMKEATNYISFVPKNFQQVAAPELYRAEEKLLYRFISEVPVFTYDDGKMLSLNSCNILIPQIEGMNIKYVLAILNSSVSAYYIGMKYHSVKLLRSHVESLPIPMVSMEVQNEIIKKVDHIMQSNENISGLYEELDQKIMDLYQLSEQQRYIIQDALAKKNPFFLK